MPLHPNDHQILAAPEPEDFQPADLVPVCGPEDGWPRTKDGWLVKPGSLVDAFGASGMIVTKVLLGLEYGFRVELEGNGWAWLCECRKSKP
jgi:hypothetical protein